MRRAMMLVLTVVLIAGCSLGSPLRKTFGTVGRPVTKGLTMAGEKTVEGVVVTGRTVGNVGKTVGRTFQGNSENGSGGRIIVWQRSTDPQLNDSPVQAEPEKQQKTNTVIIIQKDREDSRVERGHERGRGYHQDYLPSSNEVYVSSRYLRSAYMTEALDLLQQAGYVLSDNRKAPLRLNIALDRVRRGGSAFYTGERRSRYGLGARIDKYVATCYLRDQRGVVVARGWGETPSRLDFQGSWGKSRSRGLDLRGTGDDARGRAMLVAIKTMVVDHQGW